MAYFDKVTHFQLSKQNVMKHDPELLAEMISLFVGRIYTTQALKMSSWYFQGFHNHKDPVGNSI